MIYMYRGVGMAMTMTVAETPATAERLRSEGWQVTTRERYVAYRRYCDVRRMLELRALAHHAAPLEREVGG